MEPNFIKSPIMSIREAIRQRSLKSNSSFSSHLADPLTTIFSVADAEPFASYILSVVFALWLFFSETKWISSMTSVSIICITLCLILLQNYVVPVYDCNVLAITKSILNFCFFLITVYPDDDQLIQSSVLSQPATPQSIENGEFSYLTFLT